MSEALRDLILAYVPKIDSAVGNMTLLIRTSLDPDAFDRRDELVGLQA